METVVPPHIPGRRNLRSKASAVASGESSEERNCGSLLLTEIKKRALTSSELFSQIQAQHGFKGSLGTVYAALAALKKNNIIEPRTSNEDAARRWHAL